MTKVCTITTTIDVVSNARKPPTFNGRVNGVEKVSTPCAKLPKTTEIFSNKSAKKIGVWGTMVLLPLIVMILILMVAISLK
jgi:hypothetical protein